MLTTKKRVERGFWAWTLAGFFVFAGCTPSGPRAVLKGERLIREGNYEAAVAILEKAVDQLPNEPQAWNYLGLACHGAGRYDEAVKAYQKALALNRDLVAARFNLGCLYLEQSNAQAAINELTIFTQLQPNAEDGWIKLGDALLRGQRFDDAEKCFGYAARLNSQSALALNGLGLVQMQRRRYPEAARNFNDAIKSDPACAPALLNAAVVAQQYLNDRFGALQRYRQYLALKPRPAGWEAVEQAANDLEAELRPVPTPARREPAVAAASSNKPPERPVVASSERTNKPVARAVESESKPESKPAARPKPAAREIARAPRTNAPPIVVKAPPKTVPPEIKAEPAAQPEPESRPVVTAPPAKPIEVPVVEPEPVSLQGSVPRYRYRKFPIPQPGDRDEAERQVAEGLSLQENFKIGEAIERYQRAIQADPSCFEAHYDLGVASFASGDLPKTLDAYERALTLEPASVKARYNFAIALDKAGYPRDAANELEKLLDANPNQTRAYFSLGHLYANRLKETAKARACYQRVLQLEPQHTQATAIRYWLEANP